MPRHAGEKARGELTEPCARIKSLGGIIERMQIAEDEGAALKPGASPVDSCISCASETLPLAGQELHLAALPLKAGLTVDGDEAPSLWQIGKPKGGLPDRQ